MATFKFYHGTTFARPVTLADPLFALQDVANSLGPVQAQISIGSETANRKIEATSGPGVNQIVVAVIDAAGGSGETAAAIKLALTQAGLATATPGAPLNIGTEVLSGEANMVSLWAELNDITGVIGNYTDVYPRVDFVDEAAA